MVSPSAASPASGDNQLNTYVAAQNNPQFAQNLALYRPAALADAHTAPEAPPQPAAPVITAPGGEPLLAGQAAAAPAADAPAQPAAEEAPATAAAAPYSVVPGDNLSKIAKANGLSLKQLLDLNKDKLKGRDINLIYPGEMFNVTPPAAKPDETAQPSQTTPRRPADAAPGGAATPPADNTPPPSQSTPRRPADAAPGGAATPPADNTPPPSQSTPRRPADTAPGGGAAPKAAAPAASAAEPADAADYLGDFGPSVMAPVVQPNRGQASAPKYAAQAPQPRGMASAPKAATVPAPSSDTAALALAAPVVQTNRGEASAPKYAAQAPQPRGGVMAKKPDDAVATGPGVTTAMRG